MKTRPSSQERIAGLLVGGAVGDALGLPREGLSRARLGRMWPGELRHRFLGGRGMISDDTEHAFFTAQALLKEKDDGPRFQSLLAGQLRGWFAALPAGIGLATGRACLRLWLGISPKRSGVFSAGNGPAMRSAILGAVLAEEPGKRNRRSGNLPPHWVLPGGSPGTPITPFQWLSSPGFGIGAASARP